MSKNSGTILQLKDGRKVAVMPEQPLLKQFEKVVIQLLNDDLSLAGKHLIWTLEKFKEQVQQAKLIGYID